MRDDKAYIFPAYSGQANSNVIVPAIPVAQGGTAGAVAAGLLSGGFTTSGLLQIPNRGNLRVLPGDVVMIGITGWPILLSRAEAVYGQANSIWSSSVAWT
jgi:protein involved in polysaccharide export with SLBB domain